MSQIRDAPAFDFYPERWLVGVAGMSDAEQLAYLRLLCHQWLLQGLPEDVPALRRLGGGRGVTPAVLAKLPLQADGKRRNARLEIIRQEQRERIAKKSEQRRAAALKRWHSAPGAPPAGGMQSHGGSLDETDAAGMRPHCGSTCETDADDLRTPCGGPCEIPAAGMPTTHPPPPTAQVPEDTNNAGAREARTAGVVAAGADAATSRGYAAAASASTATGTAEETEVAAEGAAGSEPTPSLGVVQAWAAAIGCPPDKAEIWWHEHEARPLSAFGRWTDRDGNALRRPQHALAAWWQKWQANEHQRNARNHAPSPSTTSYHGRQRPAPAARSDSANAPGRYA